MVHKGDIKIVAQMLRNLEEKSGKVDFKAPLIVAAPTYNIIEELKDEGDWEILQSIQVLNSVMKIQKLKQELNMTTFFISKDQVAIFVWKPRKSGKR